MAFGEAPPGLAETVSVAEIFELQGRLVYLENFFLFIYIKQRRLLHITDGNLVLPP